MEFLTEIRKSGLTVNVRKCSFARPKVKFIGPVIGSGRHSPYEHKLTTVTDISPPLTERDVSRVFGFFSYIRAYILNAADKPAKVGLTALED